MAGLSRQCAVRGATRRCGLAFLLGLAIPVSAKPTESIVQVEHGKLRGICNSDKGRCSYKGVPFAAAPIGGYRWRPPQPVFPWSGIRDAIESKPQCLQINKRMEGNENCLFLNIWAPLAEKCPGGSCPVMFWIHGGYFAKGSGTWSNAKNLVTHAGDVIVVAAAYRLGAMGFMGAEELRWRDAEQGSTGNYGIQDQRAALAWVQRNIHRFGGDAGNVMIFGQSAGGSSVCHHLLNPRSWPFYSKAVVQSGAVSYWAAQTMEQAEQQYRDLLVQTNCSDDGLACLLNVSAEQVVNMSWHVPLRPRLYGGCCIAPVVDGVELKGLPWELMEAGRFNTRVPVLLGNTRDEGTFNIDEPAARCGKIYQRAFNMTAGDFVRLLTSEQYTVDLEQVPEILDVYSVNGTSSVDSDFSNWYWVATHFLGDYIFTCPSRRLARAINRFSGSSAFVYEFSHRPKMIWKWDDAGVQGLRNETGGTTHGADNKFLFLNKDGDALKGDDEVLLSKTMAGYWIHFARSSDPNLPGRRGRSMRTNLTIEWEPFTEGREISLRLDLPALSVGLGRHDRRCDVVDKLGALLPALPWGVPNRRDPPERRWCLTSTVAA